MRDTFIEELTKRALIDPNVFLITGDLGFGVLEEFGESFPDQFLNAGVAEQNMTAIAAGMAMEGRKVFTYSIGNFPTLRCLEQIRNDICYHDLDVTIVSIGGGFSYGQLGMSHHATEDISIMRALPNIEVIIPSSLDEVSGSFNHIIQNQGPKYLRLDKSTADFECKDQFTFGKASNVVQNEFDTDAAWTRTSDVRKKRNIKDDKLGLDFINKLKPVTFQWKPSNEFPKEWNEYSEENNMDLDATMHGMIAQDVKQALDDADVDTFGGWKERKDGSQTISREMFVTPLIKAVQELSSENKELKDELNELKIFIKKKLGDK